MLMYGDSQWNIAIINPIMCLSAVILVTVYLCGGTHFHFRKHSCLMLIYK